MKKLAFLIYAWSSTLLIGGTILYLATLEEMQFNENSSIDILSKTVFRIILYFLFFLLTYRSAITTFKSAVDKLSAWRSKKEKAEDTEFVLIIETLILVLVIFACSIIAIIDEVIQSSRFAENQNSEVLDVLVSEIAIIMSAIVIYTVPVIGQLEFAIKKRIERLFKK